MLDMALEHGLTLGWMLAAAFGGGRLVTAGWEWGSAAERVVVRTTLGLALLALASFALGAVGWFRPEAVVSLLGALAIAGLPGVGAAVRRGRPSRRAALGALLAVVVLAPMGSLALYPPTGFDATVYHLPFARALASSGRLEFLGDLRYPVLPALGETLQAVALEISGDLAAQLVTLSFAVLAAALLAVWSGRFLAAGLFLGSPLVVYLSASGYVDGGVALFTTAALWSIERWRARDDRRWLVLAGVFAGSAAATKYTGLVFGAVALASIVGMRPRRATLGAFALAALSAVVAAAPWYGWIVALTGNPVFPFFPGWFGESPWQIAHPSVAVDVGAAAASPVSAIAAVARVVASPLTMTIASVADRAATGGFPPSSPFLVALLPLAIPAVTASAEARRIAGVALVSWWILVAAGIPSSIHYFVPAMPLLALVVAIGGETIAARLGLRRASFAVLALVVAIAILPGSLYAAVLHARRGPVPADTAARDRHLSERLPGYAALRWLDRQRPRTGAVYALGAENLRYFAKRRFLGDWNGPASFAHVAPALADSASLAARLRELGVEWLLVRGDASRLPADAGFAARFPLRFEDRDARVYEVVGDR